MNEETIKVIENAKKSERHLVIAEILDEISYSHPEETLAWIEDKVVVNFSSDYDIEYELELQ